MNIKRPRPVCLIDLPTILPYLAVEPVGGIPSKALANMRLPFKQLDVKRKL